MLESDNDHTPKGGYHPFGTVVNLDNGQQLNLTWASITQPVTGLWNPFAQPISPVFLTDPGPRTSIVALANPKTNNPKLNNFFAGYCGAADGSSGAVYVTWGNAADYQ